MNRAEEIVVMWIIIGLILSGGKVMGNNLLEKISGYGITVTKDSSPAKIAELMIKGLDNEDIELLKQLVAVKHEKKEVDAIFAKYGKKSTVIPDEIANTVVAGWLLTYSFFAKGKTIITKTDIQGDRAIVYATAKGRVNLEDRHIRINFIKEDGWWKATAGIHQ
ncbi:MAG: hypothetical protein NC827_09510 [Candidatus Omnitrophica bacterium]|nr:hypothetical protein [Candidatus Omnitrophota bacterium]MCM8803520.1 hypothetical protein [Candidatus Omnitrophota bacterium]